MSLNESSSVVQTPSAGQSRRNITAASPLLTGAPGAATSGSTVAPGVSVNIDADADLARAIDIGAAAAAAPGPVRPAEMSEPLTIAQLWRSPSFLLVVYSIPTIAALCTSLSVDWRRGITSVVGSCTPLKEWAIAQSGLQAMILVINWAIVHALATEPPEVALDRRSFRVIAVVSHVLDATWFAWFIAGAVWTFRYSDVCRQETPFLFAACYAVVIVGFVISGLGALGCCCTCALFFVRDSLMRRMARLGAINQGATRADIASLPFAEFDPSLMEKADANCAICLCEYARGEPVAFLPCRHHFHRECVSTWLEANKTCPFCKHPIDEPFTGVGPDITTQLEVAATGKPATPVPVPVPDASAPAPSATASTTRPRTPATIVQIPP